MANSGEDSGKKKLVVRLERYRQKQVSYFEDKSMAYAYAEFSRVFDIGSSICCGQRRIEVEL
ncbi:hypothetical protein D8674_008407 [Pyrus ussuriensis x Pyrus communis]|uniref:Uncharacterized protein n=1 Tax=Pyrus ussuriensis x Pyrus communis TaxID=2448454 RepID=A0A5N5HTL2_9ROSA|nr:hypothetical protein D8674_008407 [Pyrus ussuriensis x Pyrus communis]